MSYEIKVNLGPKDISKVIVISHERSGTHFLMNTLAENFGYISDPWIDLDFNMPVNFWAADNIMNILNTMKGQPVLNTIKSHHQVEFFFSILPDILDEFLVFYIYRSARAVMESFCKHLNAYYWNAGPKVGTGRLLADFQPSGALLRYQTRQFPTMLDRWKGHVRGWLTLPERIKEQIIYVRFNDLDHDFDNTVYRISERINMNLISEFPQRPSKFDRVITPSEMTDASL